MSWPAISIIIATYNSARTIKSCLTGIRGQDYPQDKIEIILVDGGSTDKTLEIGKRYNCKTIIKPQIPSEAAKAFGLQIATGEYVADFGSDNILPDNEWLKKLTAPLLENKAITASYPLRYCYRKNDTIFNRYVALFGVNDPIPFYVGKADRQSFLYQKGYSLAGKAKKKGNYYEVTFTPENLPTVGANGFIINRNLLYKAKIDPDHYFHIDVIYDLVVKGYNTFAVVDACIIHDTAETFISLIKKRSNYLSTLYLQKIDKRRYHIVTRKDYPKLLLFIFFSLTFIQPLYLSIRGYRKKSDFAWFIHPVFCFIITLVYTKIFLFKIIRQLLFPSNIKSKTKICIL